MFRTVALAGVLALAMGRDPSPFPQARRVDLEAADCSRINMMYGDFEVGRATRHATVPLSAGRLDLQPESNGGVRIERGTGSSYSVTACIGAGARTFAEAQSAADSVQLVIDGSRVRVTGMPNVQSWSVQLVVSAPPNADIVVATKNGPISIDGASGQFDVSASNGPIAVNNVQGIVRARAQNGPIHVEGSGGQFDVETQNGPISVTLAGRGWDGRLDARAHNGPLDVHMPSDYQSGVEISSSVHSPWNCQLSACRSGNRDWDERSRSLRVGKDPVVVRISTQNGPVTVSNR
jgi:ferric-dicitrate binding protein FerR (iron transport regulator)